MARIKFGHGVADARGSVGGTVFSRNASGAYMREKVTPVNPQSSRQTAVRSRLTTLSKEWADLSEVQRSGWAALAQAYPRRDVFGNPLVLSGIAQFQACNGMLLNAGQPSISNPPADLLVPELSITTLELASASRTLSIEVTPLPLGADDLLYLELTPRFSPGISFYSNLLRFLVASPKALASTFDHIIEDRFGPYSTGDTYSIHASILRCTNGAMSSGLFVKTLTL